MVQSTLSPVVRMRQLALGVMALAVVAPVAAIAQEANFGKLALNASKPSGSLSGTTGGSTSLPAIVGNIDRNNKKCLGFGDPKPDHVLVLQQPFTNLSLRVRSGGGDTTLVIQGSDGSIRCGDDSGSQKDATIADNDWKAGTYRIWVGTATPGTQRDYTLNVQP